jgi:hypothetical protein
MRHSQKRLMRPTNKWRGSREAECIPLKACSEADNESEVKLTQRKNRQAEATDKEKEKSENSNVFHRKPDPKPSFSQKRLRHSRRRPMRQSELKATQRKSEQKRTIERKKRRELYEGDIVDC